MLLDSNIIISYLKGTPDTVLLLTRWKQTGRVLCISTITRAEVLAFPKLSASDSARARAFLNEFVSFPINDRTSERAAELRRAYGLPLADMLIAATALEHNLPLVTRDRDFQKIQEIVVIAP